VFYCNNFNFVTPVGLLKFYSLKMLFGTSGLGPRFIDRLCPNGYESVGSVGDKEFVGWWNNYGLLTGFLCCVCACY
jgi:hypothetical protein